MFRTAEQLQKDAQDALLLRQQQDEYQQRLTDRHVSKIAKAIVGSDYTNPQITAALGLSDSELDPQIIHDHATKQAQSNRMYVGDVKPPDTPINPLTNGAYTLADLFRVIKDPVNRRNKYEPDWFSKVDPTGYWRNLQVPSKVTDARELLNLDETQVIKMLMSTPWDEWNAIPNIKQRGTYTRKESTKGKKTFNPKTDLTPVPGKEGVYDLLRAKFPNYAKMIDAVEESNKPNFWQAIASSDYIQGLGVLANGPAKIGSLVIPDQFEPVAAAARGGIRSVSTAMVSLAQLTKNSIEYKLTHPDDVSTLMISPSVPMTAKDRADWHKTVIEGNILTQIAKQALDSKQKVDIGEGFFPEGKAMEEAIKAHDAGLPKIAGRTWTVGRATVEPLITSGLIDRNGFVANAISGLADATFTIGTDPNVYFDPVQALMKAYKMDRLGATVLLNSRESDIVREAWANARRQQGASTVINEVFDTVFDPETNSWRVGAKNIDVDEIPKFKGMLPPGAELPPEVEQAAQEMARKALEGKTLAALDSPPEPIGYSASMQSKVGAQQSLGVIGAGTSAPRPDPMAIDYMPFTADGRRTLEKLASFNNVGELYDSFLGNIPPGAAAQIQAIVDTAKTAGKSVDLTAIHKVLVDGVLSADPMYGVAEVPGVFKQVMKQTGSQIAYWSSGKTRQFTAMPGSTFFSFDDPMSSINDMNRLMKILKVPQADRHLMISKAIDAVVNKGPAARYELANDFMAAAIGPALRRNGAPEAWIKQITTWGGWDDSIRQWTMDKMGEGYAALWAGNDADFMRSIDFFNSGFLMAPPEHLNSMIRETNALWKLYKPLRGQPWFERVLRGEGEIKEKLTEIQNRWLKPVALGAPLPIRMVTRIIPDEMLRVAVQGNLGVESLRILSAGGQINYDTHGRVIRPMKEIMKLFPIREHLESLYLELDKAIAAADGPLARSLQDEISKIEAKHGTIKELDKIMRDHQRRADMILPGLNRTAADNIAGLMGPEINGNPSVFRYVRKNYMQHAYRSTDPKKWVIGTARDIVRMSLSPEYQLVAEVMLTGTAQDLFVDLPNRLLNGDKREILDMLIKGQSGTNPNMPLDSIQGVTQLVGTIVADISTRTALDRVLLGAIQTGKLGGRITIIDNSIKEAVEASAPFRQWITDNLLTNPNAAPVAPFHPTEVSEQTKKLDRFMTDLFRIYRDASDKTARTPFEMYEKWKRVTELIPIMDPAEASKMLDALEKTDAPEWFLDSIRRQVPNANGTATRKQIELLGTMHGKKRVAEVLYDSSKKSFFGSQQGMFFGFFDAWFEQWSVWGRQIAERPTLLAKAALAKEAFNDTGIITKDPDTEQTMVVVPFTKDVLQMLGLNGEIKLSTKNLTLLGQAVPGLFGYGALIADSVIPDKAAFAAIRGTLFPYGQPAMLNKIADYLVPAWGQALVSSGSQLLGSKYDFFDNLAQVMVGDQDERRNAVTVNAVITNIASNRGDVPLTDEERIKLLDEAQRKAAYLGGFNGFLRIFLPSVPITKMYTDLGNENVTTGQVLDDLRKFEAEEGSWAKGVYKLLNKYGPDTWIYLAGSSISTPGMQPTKEYAAWFRDNGSLVDKYPLVGGYLGPQDGEYDPKAFTEQRATGYRKPADIAVRQEKALNNLAWAIYRNAQDRLLKQGRDQGLLDSQTKSSPQYKEQMKQQAAELKKLYPMWNPKAAGGEQERELVNQIRQIERMVKDKKVLSTDAGKGLKMYWDYRTRNVAKVVNADPNMANDSWRTANGGLELRWRLEQMGAYAVKKHPEFRTLWEYVLSNEFEPSDLGD